MTIRQNLLESATFVVEMVIVTWWPLVAGFTISGAVQAFVSRDRLGELMGEENWREVGIASFFGFISSSCSFAAVATARSLYQKGASAAASLGAYQFAATNLVIEIAIVIWIVLNPTFVLADFVGGVVLIVLLASAFRYLVPADWAEDAREHARDLQGTVHDHGTAEDWVRNHTWREKLLTVEGWRKASSNAMGEWRMLWKEIAVGFVIAGLIKGFVPDAAWGRLFSLFPEGTLAWVVFGVLVGVVIGVATFVCSVANVPLALVLWQGGIPFGGVMSFIFADLIVPHIVQLYRKFYGWRMAATMFVLIFAAAALAGLLVHGLWAGLGAIPPREAVGGTKPGGYTLVLDGVFAIIFLAEVYVTYVEGRDGTIAEAIPGI